MRAELAVMGLAEEFEDFGGLAGEKAGAARQGVPDAVARCTGLAGFADAAAWRGTIGVGSRDPGFGVRDAHIRFGV